MLNAYFELTMPLYCYLLVKRESFLHNYPLQVYLLNQFRSDIYPIPHFFIHVLISYISISGFARKEKEMDNHHQNSFIVSH